LPSVDGRTPSSELSFGKPKLSRAGDPLVYDGEWSSSRLALLSVFVVRGKTKQKYQIKIIKHNQHLLTLYSMCVTDFLILSEVTL
jgi:hypothetical protein